MLSNLQVVNGSISPEFDSEIYEYEVDVDQDVVSLILHYEASDNASVTIYGNDYLTKGENHVLIEVYENELKTYILVVNKENTKTVMDNKTENAKVEVSTTNEFFSDLILPGISVICFVIIIVLFSLLFKKK